VSEELIIKKRALSELQTKIKKWFTAADIEEEVKLKKEIAVLEEKEKKKK